MPVSLGVFRNHKSTSQSPAVQQLYTPVYECAVEGHGTALALPKYRGAARPIEGRVQSTDKTYVGSGGKDERIKN